MKGLDRSRVLFEESVLPKIREEVPEVIPYLAAGLVGEGSDCFGYDDEISLDHDAGTRICLWLEEEPFFRYEGALRKILELLSIESAGCEEPLLNGWRSGVFEIGRFYEQLIHSPGCPSSNREWLQAEEASLAAAVNGEVFLDNAGVFTKIRSDLLGHYPQDVFLFKLAQEAAICAQTGQYNYIRAVKREDAVTAQMIRAAFIDHYVRAVFLINRTYRPYYKWTYKALLSLSVLGKETYERIETMLALPWNAAEEAIEEMSQALIQVMREAELTGKTSDFLMDHLPDLLTKIEDRSLLEKGVSLII